tara:strand:+ start:486 stop:1121 length:636 start_codon:yes stop_codon:yes gene_type:complete
MLEKILDFLKNKYFLGVSALVILILVGTSVMNYYKEKANEAEFKKFVEVNEEFSKFVEVNEEFSLEDLDAEQLSKNLDLNFDTFGFELVSKTILAKRALDENNFELALSLFLDAYLILQNSDISEQTKNILKDQYIENIVRIYMELEDFDGGSNFLNDNAIDSLSFHDLAGDFFKYFDKNDDAFFHYDEALKFDMEEAQRNIINLKKPLKE